MHNFAGLGYDHGSSNWTMKPPLPSRIFSLLPTLTTNWCHLMSTAEMPLSTPSAHSKIISLLGYAALTRTSCSTYGTNCSHRQNQCLISSMDANAAHIFPPGLTSMTHLISTTCPLPHLEPTSWPMSNLMHVAAGPRMVLKDGTLAPHGTLTVATPSG